MSAAPRLLALAEVKLRRLLRPLAAEVTHYLARQILRSMERASPFATLPEAGYQRGIDFYTRHDLVTTLQKVLTIYWKTCGRFPNLVTPQLYSEKVNHAKFFAPFKVPESGNKLLTAAFLPPSLEGQVSLPEVLWHDDQPRLPTNESLPPGDYFLKASHGSAMVRRIHYPLEALQREVLETICQQWLSRPYGLEQGEWWYNVFPGRLLIERSVSARNPSIALLFYVIGGDVALITVFAKSLQRGQQTRRLLLDSSFHPLASQDPEDKRLASFQLSESLKRRCLEAARAIGAQFRSVRVDLMVGDDDRIYLNEVTFSPNAGLPFVDRELDQQLGSLWPP